MKTGSKKLLLANSFGTLGYLSSILSWSWVTMLYLPAFLENEQVEKFLIPTPPQEILQQTSTYEPSTATIIFSIIVTIVVIVSTIIILIKLPSTVAKAGRTVTTKVADSAVPLVTRKHELPPAKKKRLTAQLIKVIKLFIVILPVLATACSIFIQLPMPFEVVMFVSGILSGLALVWFILQYIAARLFKVDAKSLV